MKKRLLLLVVQVLAISACLLAQDFEVAPIRLNFRSDPGDTETRTITVKNHGNRKETISFTMRDYIIHRQGNRDVLPSGSTRNSIANWVTLNPSFVELQPNEEQVIQVTFQAPVDDYTSKWGILSVSSTVERTAYSADQDLQTGIFISGRIDVFLSYNPVSTEEPNISISNLREITSDDDDERVFAVDIDNLGNTISSCDLFLIAANITTSGETKFPTTSVTAYPQTSRTIELLLPDELEKGRYSLAAILDYGSRTNLKGTQIMIEVD